MSFRLTPRSMTLDDFASSGGNNS